MESVFMTLAGIASAFTERITEVVSYPLNSNSRLFWIYLFASGIFAYFVYMQTWGKNRDARPGFLSFLFPKKVWENPSAWLDLRYFVFNELTAKFLYVSLLGTTTFFVFQLLTGSTEMVSFAWDEMWTAKGMAISFGYLLLAVAIGDFMAFYIHYLQHKIPYLWEFHKVHHSPEVMHPISNFREHPIDNIAYSIGIGAAYGALMAAISLLFGYIPRPPEVLGTPLVFFLFNIGGYHLRHSHVWLRWKGRWSMVFPSPAHHHVHHSCHPDHLDKNFAFMLPVWDVIFKTYEMPEDDRDVKFGIYGAKEQEYTTIWKIYSLPFKKVWKRLKKKYGKKPSVRTPAE